MIQEALVSIPYRLATNSFEKLNQNYYQTVSIPYRLATNNIKRGIEVGNKIQFQSLIGWLQTSHKDRSLFCFFQVSIPYRLATNLGNSAMKKDFASVSIPYRLATNGSCVRRKKNYWKRFQSLIGWLQTLLSFFKIFCCFVFQSLIGWLQTKNQIF